MRDFPACAALVEFVDGRSEVRRHSRDQLARDAQRAYDDIMGRPVSAKALDQGRKVVEDAERARRKRMKEPD